MIFYPFFENDMPLDMPPTLYNMLNSKLNYGADKRVSAYDMAEQGRSVIFDFEYPVSEYFDKEAFEKAFIDYYLTRRLGMPTWTAWKIQLRAKLNLIMPIYKALYDAMGAEFKITAGGSETKTYSENTTDRTAEGKTANSNEDLTSDGSTENESIADRRYSDTPQNHLSDIKNGEYITEYNYDTVTDKQQTHNESGRTSTLTEDSTKTANGTRGGSETITRTAPTAELLIKWRDADMNLMRQIIDDCGDLFFGIMDI